MSLTKKDIENIEQQPFKEPPFINSLEGLFQFISKIPFVKKYFQESIGGLHGNIFRHRDNNEYELSTEVALFALEKYRNKKSLCLQDMIHHHWWSFMQLGVESATHTENQMHKDKLIDFANSGIEPFEGYNVAYSYLEFSKWSHLNNDTNTAIKYVKKALKADKTWGEPDFILGWYALLFGMDNAELYLSQAIEKDKGYLLHIINNDICQQHPNIINNLTFKYSDENKNQSE